MIKDGKIGTYEAFALASYFLATKVFYTSIRTLIKSTGTSAWYATIISCLISLILFILVYRLMKRFPGKELSEIFELVTGKIIGKSLSLIFVGYLIYYVGSNLREFLEMIKAYILPYTPPSLILFAFMLVVATFAYLGFETIARVSAIFYYVGIASFTLILGLAYPYYNIHAVLPIGGYGLTKTLTTGLLRSSAYNEIVFFAFVINAIRGLKVYKRIGILSLLMSGFFISLSIFCSILAFDFTQGSENISDLFQLTRIIYFSRFFQRVEPIFIFIWVMASFISIGVAFYISLSIFCKAFKVEGHRPLIFPFAFLSFMVALLPKNLSEATQINVAFLRQNSSLIVYVIPLLVFIFALITGKKGEKKNHAEN